MTPEEAEWSDILRQAARERVLSADKKAPQGAVEVSLRGAGQGASSNWIDEAAARVDQGISKIPVLRSVLPHDERFPPLTDPSVSYEQRRDAYRQANADAQATDPERFRDYEIGGALLQQATMARTPLRPLVTPLGTKTGAAQGALQGAIAGAGASEGTTTGEVLKDAGKGGAVGTVFGGLGGFLGHAVPEPVARATEPTVTQELGGMAKGKLKSEIGARREAIGAVTKTYPEVRKAFGDPEAVLAASEAPMAELDNKRLSIYAAADQAAAVKNAGRVREMVASKVAPKPFVTPSEMYGTRGMPGTPARPDMGGAVSPSDALRPTAGIVKGVTGVDPAALAAAGKEAAGMAGGGVSTAPILDKLHALEGLAASAKGPGGVERPAVQKVIQQLTTNVNGQATVPAVQLRKFMSDYLAPDTLPSAQTSTEIAKREAYNLIRDELRNYVGEHLGAKAAGELDKTNQLLSGLTAVRDIAKQAANSAASTMPKVPKPPPVTTENDRIRTALQNAPIAGPAARSIAGGLSQLAPAMGRPVIDRLAGQHRQTLEDLADAAKRGDVEAVKKNLTQQMFGE